MSIQSAAIAAIALLLGIAPSFAADQVQRPPSDVYQSSPPGTSKAPELVVPGAQDKLALTADQQHTVYQAISQKDTQAKPPAGFSPSVGAVVPGPIKTHPIPSEVSSQIPVLKQYDYAMLDKQLVIVNPMDKKIVDIITK